MNRIAAVVLFSAIALTFAPRTYAHHSAAGVLLQRVGAAVGPPTHPDHRPGAFDHQEGGGATGTVTEFAFRNPHVYLVLQVKKPDGSPGRLEVEAGAASVLNPLGFTK